jgi:hypothetical protein
MAVLFGEIYEGDWIKIHSIQYQLDEHPNGYSVDVKEIPEYPPQKAGIIHTQLYNTNTKQWRFDEVSRPHTEPEALLEIAAAIRELAAAISNK